MSKLFTDFVFSFRLTSHDSILNVHFRPTLTNNIKGVRIEIVHRHNWNHSYTTFHRYPDLTIYLHFPLYLTDSIFFTQLFFRQFTQPRRIKQSSSVTFEERSFHFHCIHTAYSYFLQQFLAYWDIAWCIAVCRFVTGYGLFHGPSIAHLSKIVKAIKVPKIVTSGPKKSWNNKM